MILVFDKFYHLYGVRGYMNLATPKIWPIRELPKNSIIHCLTDDDKEFPDSSSILLKSNPRRVLLKNFTVLSEDNHSVGKITISVQNKVFDFIQKEKQFLLFPKPLTEAKEENQLVYCNYNLVKILYRYQESNKMTPYWKWYDRQLTMWEEVETLCKTSQRNHFYEFKVPMELPSGSRLNQHVGLPTQETAKRFDTAESRFLLDFWKWLNPDTRQNSSLSKISVGHFPKVNIVFLIKDGRSSVLNLGFMNSWVKGQPNQTDRPNTTGIDPRGLQTLFLKFLMVLQGFSVEIDKAGRESETLAEDDGQSLDAGTNQDTVDTATEDDSEMDDGEDTEEATFGGKRLPEYQGIKPANITGSEIISSAKKSKSDSEETEEPERPLTLEETLKKLEEETKSLEEVETLRDKLRGKDKEEVENYDPTTGPTEEVVNEKVFDSKTPQERLIEKLDNMAASGSITAADYRKILKTLESQADKLDPYGSGKTLLEASTTLPEDLIIDEKTCNLKVDERILDSSMSKSVVENLDRDYISKAMSKDILGSIMAIQNNGVIVTNIETEIQHSALGSFERHTISLKPLGGQSSTVSIKIPKVDEDGTFKANGVRYHMRKQRVDAPIRKIGPDRVGLSSYYGKLFIFRSPKKSDSAVAAVIKKLNLASIGEIEDIPKVIPADVFDNKFEAPYIYNAIANNYKGFEINHAVFGKLTFNFEHHSRAEDVSEDQIKLIEKDGKRIAGRNAKGAPIYVDNKNMFFVKLKEGEQPLGDIFDILEIERTTVPVDPAMIKVMGRTLPLGIVLARATGFKGLLKLLKSRYRLVKGRQQKNLLPFEYVISFKDYSFVFDRRDEVASLVLSGFDVCAKQLKAFPAASYDIKEVYDELLDGIGAGVMTCRELDLLETSFVDPITKGLLNQMKEPETFLGLLVRSSELLTTYHHPNSQDMDFQNIRGYERFSGAIYREFIKSTRTFRNKNISGRSKVEMSPYAVWQGIMEDASVKTCEDINPIQNLKMHESVTFVGEGGRAKEAFMKDARAFNENDVGVISEASVDSSDVGINIFLTGNPMLKNLRGQKEKGFPEAKAGHYLSTSLLLATGAQHDDQKRNVFVSIQNGHTIACEGYRQPYVQTGYETVASQRVDDLFCFTAKDKGKVISLTDKAIQVEYGSGEKKGIYLGRQYGSAEGSTYPHDILPLVKEGDKFEQGDVIAYNTGFWEQDFLDPKKVVMKFSLMTNVAYEEDARTHEDSCSISNDLSLKLGAATTKINSFTVRFTQNLHDVQKPGTVVEPEDILMSIEDEITSGTGMFDAESSALLGKLSRMNPRAGYSGTIDKIEVFYHGEKIDMSPALKAVADKSDKAMIEQAKQAGKPQVTGRVNSEYRVAGKPLQLDTAELRFYITVHNGMSSGDKTVFANQLKSTVGELMDYSMRTESGIKVDARFGGRSAIKRVVNSYAIIGTTTGILQEAAKKMIEMYES